MREAGKLTFAPFVAVACGLWIVAAATGSQGFTAIIGLLAIASLFFHRPSGAWPAYVWSLLALVIWITFTATWSPANTSWVSGSMTGEDFAVDVASIRLGGVAVFSALAISAALALSAGGAQKSNRAILIICGLLAIALITAFAFRGQILAFAYPNNPNDARIDGYQNFVRAGNAVAVLLPVGIAAAWQAFASRIVRIALCIFSLSLLIVFQLLGSQSAVLSFVLMLAGIAIVYAWPRTGLKQMLRLTAGYILLAPLILLGLTWLIGISGVSLPESFQARVFAWQHTLSKLTERPFTGHGLEASGTWKETYATHPDWLETLTGLADKNLADAMNRAWQNYPVVPGHPHNMPLEVWAETGVVGALLAAITFWLLAARMPSITEQNRYAIYAGAGLIGAATPLFSFAYSAWNESYWGMLAIAVCAVILMSKRAMP